MSEAGSTSHPTNASPYEVQDIPNDPNPISDLDYEEALEEPYGPMIDPDDDLEFVKKAIISAAKDKNYPLYESEILGPKASKWLTRAEASVFKNRKLVEYIQKYYRKKMSKVKTSAARERANAKGEIWNTLFDDDEIKDHQIGRITHTGEMYGKMAQKIKDKYEDRRQSGAFQEELQAIDAQYQYIKGLEYAWYHGTDPHVAWMYALAELKNANEAWIIRQRTPNAYNTEMDRCAERAISWNMIAKELILREKAEELAKHI